MELAGVPLLPLNPAHGPRLYSQLFLDTQWLLDVQGSENPMALASSLQVQGPLNQFLLSHTSDYAFPTSPGVSLLLPTASTYPGGGEVVWD